MGLGPASAKQLITVHPRQHDVEQNQAGVRRQRQVEAFLAMLGCQDLVALGLEGVLEAPQERGLILDDQDSCAAQAVVSMARS